jgi:hypothetical protein
MDRDAWATACLAPLFMLAGIGLGTVVSWIVEAL